jgi:hypothetical protein
MMVAIAIGALQRHGILAHTVLAGLQHHTHACVEDSGHDLQKQQAGRQAAGVAGAASLPSAMRLAAGCLKIPDETPSLAKNSAELPQIQAQQPAAHLKEVLVRVWCIIRAVDAPEAIQGVDLAWKLGAKGHLVDDVAHVGQARQHVASQHLQKKGKQGGADMR